MKRRWTMKGKQPKTHLTRTRKRMQAFPQENVEVDVKERTTNMLVVRVAQREREEVGVVEAKVEERNRVVGVVKMMRKWNAAVVEAVNVAMVTGRIRLSVAVDEATGEMVKMAMTTTIMKKANMLWEALEGRNLVAVIETPWARTMKETLIKTWLFAWRDAKTAAVEAAAAAIPSAERGRGEIEGRRGELKREPTPLHKERDHSN